MKAKTLMLCGLLSLSMISACSDNPDMDAVAPRYSSITFSPATPNSGDSVVCTVDYANEGNHWYGAKYSWKVSGPETGSGPVTRKGSGKITSKAEKPTFGFVVPKDSIGTYTVTFVPGYVQASSLFAPNGTVTSTTSIDNGSITFTVTK